MIENIDRISKKTEKIINNIGNLDTFYYLDNVVARLINIYNEHGNLILAVDFDDTLYSQNSKIKTENSLNLLKHFMKIINIKIIINTLNTNTLFIQNFCKSKDLKIETINENIVEEFKDSKKIFANLYFDDKSSLYSSFVVLNHFVATYYNLKSGYNLRKSTLFENIDNKEKINYYEGE